MVGRTGRLYRLYRLGRLGRLGLPGRLCRLGMLRRLGRCGQARQAWLAGPGFDPVLVVDEGDIVWRQFSNVSIDTLAFSVFFGNAEPAYRARKDEVRHTLRE